MGTGLIDEGDKDTSSMTAGAVDEGPLAAAPLAGAAGMPSYPGRP
jgi:hypothetical protein